MTPLHPTRRAAERFDALVEGDWHDAVDPKTAELLELVGAVQAVAVDQAPAARPEFVSGLREQLMRAAETELVVIKSDQEDVNRRLTVTPHRRTARERRIAVAVGGFAIIGATTSMAVAAQNALPGDALYPVKRAIENAEAGFRVSDDAKGHTILANASGRLAEVDELASQGNGANAADIEQTLDTFSAQATEAGDLLLADYEHTGSEDSISELRDFTASSLESLSALQDVIPDSAEAALLNAAQVIFALDAAATNACPTCDGGISEVPPALLASGGQALDEAATALANLAQQTTGQALKPKPSKPGKGKDKDKPASEGQADTSNPTSNPTGAANNPGSGANPSGAPSVNVGAGTGGGQGGKKDKPPVDLSPVKDVVDEVVESVNEVVGGLGLGNKPQG